MNEMTDFQRYCAGLDEQECIEVKAKLLREKHIGSRMKSPSWVNLADEMIEAVDKRLEYLDGIRMFKAITQVANHD